MQEKQEDLAILNKTFKQYPKLFVNKTDFLPDKPGDDFFLSREEYFEQYQGGPRSDIEKLAQEQLNSSSPPLVCYFMPRSNKQQPLEFYTVSTYTWQTAYDLLRHQSPMLDPLFHRNQAIYNMKEFLAYLKKNICLNADDYLTAELV